MTEDERWPEAGEYAQAARDPERFLLDPTMRNGRLRTSPLGIPLPATGRNAAVFRLSLDDHDVAVRVFTRQPSEGRRRYDALRAYVQRQAIPSFAEARWIPDAVAVDDRTLPMICMEWIDGLTLDRYVERHLDDATALRDLASRWVDLLFALEASDVAHGDLQHGNILVEPDGQIRLVDLDGIWTPATTDLEPNEVGHRNYQHPQRLAEGYWGRSVDAFSALAIAVSLEAVAQRPEIWHAHNDGANNLLLADRDYREPEGAPVWQELADLEEPVPTLTRRLAEACRSDVSRLRTPTELVRGSGPVTTKAPPRYLVERLHRETSPEPPTAAEAVPLDQRPPPPAPSRPVEAGSPAESGPAPESRPVPRSKADPAPDATAPGRRVLDSAVVFVLVATVLAVVVVIVGIATLGLAAPAPWSLGAVTLAFTSAGGWPR